MRRNSFLTFLKEKSFLIVLTLMLVSAGTMAALFTLGGTDESEKNEVAKKEEIQVETPLVNEAKKEETTDETANLLPKTRIIKKATDNSPYNKVVIANPLLFNFFILSPLFSSMILAYFL